MPRLRMQALHRHAGWTNSVRAARLRAVPIPTLALMRGRLLAALLCLACCICGPTCSASSGIDFSDLWWNAREPGWGMSVHQQGDVLFVAILVYDRNASPTWYTASAFAAGHDVEGNPLYAGDLYRSAGTPFDAQFNPAALALLKVGSMSFASNGPGRAFLTYTVDNVTITKNVERQTWQQEDYSGHYIGALGFDINPLHGPCIGGHREELGPITITQGADGKFALVLDASARRCTYAGTYSQSGHIGTVTGNFNCSDGAAGTFELYEMQRSGAGITGRLHGTDVLCEYIGQFGGATR